MCSPSVFLILVGPATPLLNKTANTLAVNINIKTMQTTILSADNSLIDYIACLDLSSISVSCISRMEIAGGTRM